MYTGNCIEGSNPFLTEVHLRSIMQNTLATLKYKYDSPSGNVSYLLFQPEHIFSFTEGQFCMIETDINEKKMRKPYSIASTNLLLQEEKCI